MAIYTKKGDKGETGLFVSKTSEKKRVSKSSQRIKTLGAIDELNSFIGICISFSQDKKLNKILEGIQDDLLTIGSIVGGSSLRFTKSKTIGLEKIIDGIEKELPPLKNFILPGGTNEASMLQFARSLARRAEREVVTFDEKEKLKPQILTYVNRLSDLLFMLARETNHNSDVKDKIWRK